MYILKNLHYPDLLTFDLCCGINWKFDVKGRIQMISNPYIISTLLYIYSCTLLLEVYTGLIYKSIRVKYYIMFNVIFCVHNSSWACSCRLTCPARLCMLCRLCSSQSLTSNLCIFSYSTSLCTCELFFFFLFFDSFSY